MSVKPTYYCDVCGADRKEANHWFVIEIVPGESVHIWTWKQAEERGLFTDDNGKHLCGQACVNRIVDDWMSESTKLTQ